ncbi:transcriptional regulator [Fimicolochytrium jonesii]|uniref:transcriptional regulator n=1 Tax=Fimicolochytrium jonesii TaxID=1396493 RepID=UPI0022FE0509|nr:transcriptional regulator [Fimicolochytrium jonesii]KAI8821639.1 transcriptional regulator [Fimicolochytrium jonesii]
MLVVAVLFPCWEVLDVQGPFSVLAKVAAVSESSEQYAFAWVGEQTKEPIPSSAHFPVLADYDWDSCPQADVLLIPGGPGSLTAAFDRKLLDFVRRQSKTARRVASICTGSSILAEAGLLDGRRATSNKAVFGLQTQSVTWIRDARYVTDGKFTTASGVSAGLDIGFDLAKELFSAVQADKVAGLVGYVPLSDGDDPFATLHKPTGMMGALSTSNIVESVL